mmetsp:Transcript_61605/g.174978  ORF Transcript_61605/g.174978 Transcript_61605/m.174978 type:complete len:203 (+) Transcript_61605:1151-1759(+)
MSIFSTVKLLRKMKTRYNMAVPLPAFSQSRFMTTDGPSRKVACIRSVRIEMITFGKYMSATSLLCSVFALKMMPNTKSMTTSSSKVVSTPRAAAERPLRIVRASGTARSSRAMRVRRSRRRPFSMGAAPMPFWGASWPSMATMRVITQDSITMIDTRTVSKTNQASFMQSRFRWKAMKRMLHSPRKKTTKACSATWNGVLAL